MQYHIPEDKNLNNVFFPHLCTKCHFSSESHTFLSLSPITNKSCTEEGTKVCIYVSSSDKNGQSTIL